MVRQPPDRVLIPVIFILCGVTPPQAALEAKVELLLAHSTAHGFITDLKADALAVS